jgi:hypothetical protein
MRECWVIFWLETPEGEDEEHTAVMTGNGTLPPRPKDVQGDFMTSDVQFADVLLHLYLHERIPEITAITLSRIAYQNGDLGKP